MNKAEYEQAVNQIILTNSKVANMLDSFVLAVSKRQVAILNTQGVSAQIEYLRQQLGEEEAFSLIVSADVKGNVDADSDDDPYNVYEY